MSHLTLTGVSDDRSRLLLVNEQGTEFSLEITPALRSALRGDVSRIGQLEIQMDSALRPRDIQARIRAGETAEQVAEAARTSVERIMPFVAPVLAERQHVAERAQRASLRRAPGEASASRTLGDSVAAHLKGLNVDPEAVEWDAWRREDGRWTLTAGFSAGARGGTAHFVYDAPGNYVIFDDDDARWLVGDAAEEAPGSAPVHDDLQAARTRRLSAVAADELPLGADAIELVAPEAPVPQASPAAEAPPAPAHPVEPAAAPAEQRVHTDTRAAGADVDAGDAGDAGADDEMDQTAIRRPVQKKKGRASVPSWDEIMFGPGEG